MTIQTPVPVVSEKTQIMERRASDLFAGLLCGIGLMSFASGNVIVGVALFIAAGIIGSLGVRRAGTMAQVGFKRLQKAFGPKGQA